MTVIGEAAPGPSCASVRPPRRTARTAPPRREAGLRQLIGWSFPPPWASGPVLFQVLEDCRLPSAPVKGTDSCSTLARLPPGFTEGLATAALPDRCRSG